MRKPRPEAFDPTYRKRSPKAEDIDISGIVPLKQKSSPNPTPTAQPPQQTSTSTNTKQANGRTSERTNERTDERANGRTDQKKPAKTIRYSFQFHPEQIEALKHLRLEMELAGERVDLSQLARDAFDAYLSANGRTSERTNA